MRNPKFDQLLKEMEQLHDKKNADYAMDSNPYSNFEFAAAFAKVSLLQVYLVLIGIKTARLHELLGAGKVAQNESVNDTLIDFANYAAIGASQLRRQRPTIAELDAILNSPDSTPKTAELGAGHHIAACFCRACETRKEIEKAQPAPHS